MEFLDLNNDALSCIVRYLTWPEVILFASLNRRCLSVLEENRALVAAIRVRLHPPGGLGPVRTIM